MFKRLQVLVILFAILVLGSSWGFLVHRTVNQLAIYHLPEQMQPFFHSNMEYLVNNAPRPDIRRNQDSTEASKHFIDLEMYGADAAYAMPMEWTAAVKKHSRDSLVKYGYVPYHIVVMKERLTRAFRNRDKDSILFYAADLGHYIGDANVPLHTSANYDGQLTGQKGLHSLWESTIPELDINSYRLYTDHKAQYLAHPAEAAWLAVRRGAKLVPDLLRIEKEVTAGFTDSTKYRIRMNRGRESRSYTTAFARAYAAALKGTVNDQLLNAADMIADFWYTSWVDGGKPDLSGITFNWDETARQKLQKELGFFRENKLIENKLLLSRKSEAKEPE